MGADEATDVTSILSDLERKLVNLERELRALGGGSGGSLAASPPEPASRPEPASPPEPPPGEAESRQTGVRVEHLRREIAALVRFREQLDAAAKELVAQYDRLLDRLRGSLDATASGAPRTVVVDAGPFADLAMLQAFEQALRRVEGAEPVRVRFAGATRALVDVEIGDPQSLARLLTEQVALPVTLRGAGSTRLTVDLAAEGPGPGPR